MSDEDKIRHKILDPPVEFWRYMRRVIYGLTLNEDWEQCTVRMVERSWWRDVGRRQAVRLKKQRRMFEGAMV